MTQAADPGWTQHKLQQKLFSIAEDFWIENDRGEAVYKVNGKLLHVRETFVLEDAGGIHPSRVRDPRLRPAGGDHLQALVRGGRRPEAAPLAGAAATRCRSRRTSAWSS